jgi:hypothetical protein
VTLLEASDELVPPDAVECTVLGRSKSESRLEAAVRALRFGSADLDELRMGFRADIAAALEPHWFGSDRVSPRPRRAVEHFDRHFEHSRKKFSFHTHQKHTIVVRLWLQIIRRKMLTVRCPALAIVTPTTRDSFSRDLENFNFRPLDLLHTPERCLPGWHSASKGVWYIENSLNEFECGLAMT